jgi:tetratricopeptide (TPR) repeat protein
MKSKRHGRAVIFVGIICFFVAAFAVYGCAGKEEKKAKHLERARQYIAKNELKKAVIELKNVVQLDPNDDEAYVELGETHLKLQETREAFRAFSTAASVNPENLTAQIKVGQMLLLGRQTEEARERVELILEKVPDHVEVLSLLAGVQIQEKDIEGAIETLEKAASKDPSHFNTQLSLGRLFLLKGEPKKAEEAYLKAVSLDPGSSVPYIELSRIHASKGEWDRAEEELKRMLRSSGSSYQNLNVLALFYESRKQYDQAENTYLQAVDAAPREDATPLINLGAYYGRMKSYDKALEALEKASERRKDDLTVRFHIAQLLFDFNRMDKAESTVDGILSIEKGHVGAGFLKGRFHLARKEFEKAVDRFDRVIRENPRNAAAHHFRALANSGRGEDRLAKQDLVKAVDLDPGLLDARLILAGVYLRERNQDLAAHQIDAALKMAPQDVRVLMLYGGLKMLQKDTRTAEQVYSNITRIDPGYAPAYVQLGLAQDLMGKRQEALASFNKALELNPVQIDALASVVGHHVRDKKYNEALKACEKHRKAVEGTPEALARIQVLEGNIFLAKQDTLSAEARFRQAIETDPNLAAPYLALAQIYVGEKRFDQAIAEYESILEKNPKYLAGYVSIGSIYDLKGEGEAAETYYRKALGIRKDFGPAANNLAWNLAERGGNIDEALTYAQIAKAQIPDSAAVMDTLGWVYYLKGSYLNAIAEFQDSLVRDPNNAMINYHMGMAQYKNNDRIKAREFLEKALQLDPGFKGASEARNVLDEIKSK